MELTNKKTEPVVATTNENLPTPNKLVATSKVEQVKSFRAYAFEKAGLKFAMILKLGSRSNINFNNKIPSIPPNG